MHNNLNPALIENIKDVIETLANGNSWIMFGADDKTAQFNLLFKGEEYADVNFLEVRDIYYYIPLPHDLHAVLTDEYQDMQCDEKVKKGNKRFHTSFNPYSEEDEMLKQNINLYICESPPECDGDEVYLGSRIVHITWCKLSREIPFGIEKIHTTIRNATLEDSQRLPLIMQIIHKVSEVPALI